MEQKTYLENHSIISPLGWSSHENLKAVLEGRGGFAVSKDRKLSDADLPLALLDWKELEKRFADIQGRNNARMYTRFEKLGILSIHEALKDSLINPADPETVFILSTTKGNVELLDQARGFQKDRLFLWKSAQLMGQFFRIKSRPVIISNACISGVSAMLFARQMISTGACKHAIVLGADLVSRFVVSGFQSFLSLSPKACRPFDRERDGLSLGEAASCMIFSRDTTAVELVSGSTSNDANHISGPSRDGQGLLLAIKNTLKGKEAPELISAHGTATPYNDEMESIALSRASLTGIRVNSLKGYFGHTLGAAGILESLVNLEAMKKGFFPATRGFSTPGVSGDIFVSDRTVKIEANSLLKIASGFGGCNAAALFKLKE